MRDDLVIAELRAVREAYAVKFNFWLWQNQCRLACPAGNCKTSWAYFCNPCVEACVGVGKNPQHETWKAWSLCDLDCSAVRVQTSVTFRNCTKGGFEPASAFHHQSLKSQPSPVGFFCLLARVGRCWRALTDALGLHH